MTAIAEGRVLAVLAVAEPDFLLFCQGEFLGTKACAFVIPVAHGLVAAQSAGAPPMVSGFKFKSDRFGFKDFRKVTHKPHNSRRCPRGQRIASWAFITLQFSPGLQSRDRKKLSRLDVPLGCSRESEEFPDLLFAMWLRNRVGGIPP